MGIMEEHIVIEGTTLFSEQYTPASNAVMILKWRLPY